MQELEATVTKIVYQSPENDFKVLLVKTEKGLTEKVTGLFPSIQKDDSLIFHGNYEDNKYGRSFKAEKIARNLPKSRSAILQFLQTPTFSGIGPVLAERIVEKFGQDIFSVLTNTPDRLLEVEGIGRKKKEEIVSGWNRDQQIYALMEFLHEYGISYPKIIAIHKQYGNTALDTIRDNPYVLTSFAGIGFERVDAISLKKGIKPDNPNRVKAGCEYTLLRSTFAGHTCYPLSEWVKDTTALLNVPKVILRDTIKSLREQNKITLQATNLSSNPFVYLTYLYEAEQYVADVLKGRIKEIHTSNISIDDLIAKQEEATGITLNEEQRRAVELAITNETMILTGSAGVGKTTVSNFIIDIFTKRGYSVSLASPTGKAALRLSEVSGYPASTLHRLIGQRDPETDEIQEISCDVLLIDEFSMVDIHLFYRVLEALPEGAHLILVGDDNQLPSVQPGTVLKDMLDAKVFPHVCLTQIYRQAQESAIVKAAHAIKDSQKHTVLELTKGNIRDKVDMLFVRETDPIKINENLIRVLERVVPMYGFTHEDTQILTPMKKYENGVINLNRELQEVLNPGDMLKREISLGGVVFREGDKVIQTKNDYSKGIYNGDVGTITGILKDAVSIDFSLGREVDLDKSDLINLDLAYAITIHKSQGSQYPVVIIPISREHRPMMYRNLLYTAVTRASDLVVVIGDESFYNRAVITEDSSTRYSSLLSKLKPRNVIPESRSEYQKKFVKK